MVPMVSFPLLSADPLLPRGGRGAPGTTGRRHRSRPRPAGYVRIPRPDRTRPGITSERRADMTTAPERVQIDVVPSFIEDAWWTPDQAAAR